MRRRRLVEHMDGDWSHFQANVNIVKSAIDSVPTETLVENLIADFNEVFDGKNPKSRARPEDVKNARQAIKVVDGWSKVKDAGVPAIPKGNATKAAQELLSGLADLGLHVVPVGEVEGFAPAIGSHGPAWTVAALEAGVHQDKSNPARDFISQVTKLE